MLGSVDDAYRLAQGTTDFNWRRDDRACLVERDSVRGFRAYRRAADKYP